MKAALVSAATLMLVSFTTGPARAQQAPPAASVAAITLPAELDRVLRDYERAWRANDEQGLAALFTQDGFVPSRAGWIRGRDAIAARYANSGGALKLQAYAYATDGGVGYIVGGFGYGEGAFNGKFVLALRRTGDGPWLIAADIDQ